MNLRSTLSALSLLLLAACQGEATITLLAFSDYHSHATPFYSEGKPNQAGIARAIAYLKSAKEQPNTLVVSGGDMVNLGIPTWSDAYRCVEWPWFNGLVDVMALGNHDFDYGQDEFQRCRASVTYPIISGNLAGADGVPLLQVDGKPYLVKTVNGIKLGFFALAGPDIQRLVRAERLPVGAKWLDVTTQATSIVGALRNEEKVDAVVFIGHQLREDDAAMVAAVPGIDLVLGTHSHLKSGLTTFPGTQTYFISPFQYLTYLSEVRLRFRGGKLAEVTGGLVKMDETLPEEPDIAASVAELQRQLVANHPERFQVIGQAQIELSDANVSTGESLIGNWATEVLRRAGGTHVFFTTASAFRAAIPPGDVTMEAFLTAIPYKNLLATADVTGQQLKDWIALSVSKSGSDGFSQQSGVRYSVSGGQPMDIQVLRDPANPGSGYAPLDLEATYKLGSTDYQAYVAGGYKDLFALAQNQVKTTLDAQAALIAAIRAGPITSALDGRAGN